jgi:hypothetical protein
VVRMRFFIVLILHGLRQITSAIDHNLHYANYDRLTLIVVSREPGSSKGYLRSVLKADVISFCFSSQLYKQANFMPLPLVCLA